MEHQYTIPELKVLHAAGVPIQFGTDWAALTAPEWTNHPTSYRPDPAEWMRQPDTPPPEPDKKRILAELQAGREVPGAKLKQTQRIAIA